MCAVASAPAGSRAGQRLWRRAPGPAPGRPVSECGRLCRGDAGTSGCPPPEGVDAAYPRPQGSPGVDRKAPGFITSLRCAIEHLNGSTGRDLASRVAPHALHADLRLPKLTLTALSTRVWTFPDREARRRARFRRRHSDRSRCDWLYLRWPGLHIGHVLYIGTLSVEKGRHRWRLRANRAGQRQPLGRAERMEGRPPGAET